MRVAVVTESFLPQVNGVTNSVLRVCEQMQRHGNRVLVLAPGRGLTAYANAEVVRTPSLALPGYRDFRVGPPWPGMVRALRSFGPDVIHLASPAALGAHAAWAARRIDVPVVAVYQTDIGRFFGRYGLSGTERAVWRYLRYVHGHAALTLAPSHDAVATLRRRGIPRVDYWPRGVDGVRFSPAHRSESWRARHAGPGQVLVGYVGRLAAEKEVELLAGLRGLGRVRLVVVGDGPLRRRLEQQLPDATFLGLQTGPGLSRAVASLDVFVHTGSSETFCQAAQEALASAVPVVAPAAGGLLDLVQPGGNGLLFPAGSRQRLRTQVQRLVQDEDLRRRLARAARPSVLHRSWDAVGDQLLGHYGRVLHAAAAHGRELDLAG